MLSNRLSITGVRLSGLKLPGTFLSFSLKIDVTLAIFHTEGREIFNREELNVAVRDRRIPLFVSLSCVEGYRVRDFCFFFVIRSWRALSSKAVKVWTVLTLKIFSLLMLVKKELGIVILIKGKNNFSASPQRSGFQLLVCHPYYLDARFHLLFSYYCWCNWRNVLDYFQLAAISIPYLSFAWHTRHSNRPMVSW